MRKIKHATDERDRGHVVEQIDLENSAGRVDDLAPWKTAGESSYIPKPR